ncbi:MAG: substrate-binding domain-containing protein [Dehalococcoidia bacterium]
MRHACFALATLALFAATSACGGDGETIILATTTSTDDSGLLDELVPIFEDETGIDVKVIAVGTGAALAMAASGDADVVLAHAPAAEREYVASGDLVEGALVMHNDFVIVGPPGDPAGAASAGSLDDALRAIATGGTFISRGDGSGTHQMELSLWAVAGIDPGTVRREETGQGMGATLNVAGQRRAYTLTDRATYLALREDLDLAILVEGDARLLNIYHVYVVNPGKHEGVRAQAARAFARFLVRDDVQQRIGSFGVAEFGEPLFVPDAGKTVDQLAR